MALVIQRIGGDPYQVRYQVTGGVGETAFRLQSEIIADTALAGGPLADYVASLAPTAFPAFVTGADPNGWINILQLSVGGTPAGTIGVEGLNDPPGARMILTTSVANQVAILEIRFLHSIGR